VVLDLLFLLLDFFNCSDGVYFFVFILVPILQKKKENQIRKYMNTKHM
jgi:hypothetical protein